MIRRWMLVVAGPVALVAVVGAAESNRRPGAAAGATVRNFVKSSACSHFGTRTAFALASAAELQAQHGGLPSQTWIDLSIFDNGFALGTFIGAGPFQADARFDWQGMTPGVRHYYRVNALFPTGWRQLGDGSFVTPDCANIMRYDCQAGQDLVRVTFNVPPASPVAGSVPAEQVIDVSLTSLRYNSYFATAGPLPGNGTVFAFQDLYFARNHNYRVNARYEGAFNGWIIQRTGSFVTPDCRLLPAAA